MKLAEDQLHELTKLWISQSNVALPDRSIGEKSSYDQFIERYAKIYKALHNAALKIEVVDT